MRIILCILGLLCCSLVASGQVDYNQQANTTRKSNIVVDTPTYVIFPYTKDRYYSKGKQLNLTVSDLNIIEDLFRKRIQRHNNLVDSIIKIYPKEYEGKSESLFIYPEKYVRQYMPYLNDKNEKIVYVNCVCFEYFDSPKEWHTKWLLITHGNCNFSFEVNISNRSYSPLHMDGGYYKD